MRRGTPGLLPRSLVFLCRRYENTRHVTPTQHFQLSTEIASPALVFREDENDSRSILFYDWFFQQQHFQLLLLKFNEQCVLTWYVALTTHSQPAGINCLAADPLAR